MVLTRSESESIIVRYNGKKVVFILTVGTVSRQLMFVLDETPSAEVDILAGFLFLFFLSFNMRIHKYRSIPELGNILST